MQLPLGAPPRATRAASRATGAAPRATGAAPRATGAPPRAIAQPLARFDAVERAVHWTNAALFVTLILTGAALYFTPLIAFVGRRNLVEHIHLYAGLALPLPLLLSLSGSWGRALRRDLRRFNRWSEADRRWLREALRAERGVAVPALPPALGKFNPGQKLNAAFTAGGGVVMLATGCLLRWFQTFPLSWRAGATFVHNWLAVLFVVVIAGHVALAFADREALRSMLLGKVSRAWAARHAPAWLHELGEGDDSKPPTAAEDVTPRP